MNITIVGGGNIGTQFAVHSSEKGHSVKVFTSCPERFDKNLTVVDKAGRIIHQGEIVLATNDPETAFCDADIVMVTMPPTMMIPIAQILYEHVDIHTMIGFVPGNGGFEFAFKDCIERGNVLFGIDRVPAIARLVERGKTVCCSGYKDQLQVAALPSIHTEECAALIEDIYDIPCVRLPGFMALTLTPSNPILHTARLKTIFNDYEPGVTYESLPLFYEEWDDDSSALLLACDDEIQNICQALPEFGLEYVVSERKFYRADTIGELTNAICTEESLLGINTPSICCDSIEAMGRGLNGLKTSRHQVRPNIEKHAQRRYEWRMHLNEHLSKNDESVGDKNPSADKEGSSSENNNEKCKSIRSRARLIPDLHSRYFTADFPYGLAVIQQIGNIAGVSMPNIDDLIEWYDKIAIVNDKLFLSDYGIFDINDLRAFYLR